MRGLLLAVLVFGIAGTLVELVLLSHYEGVLQLAPLVLLGISLGVIGWHLARPGAGTVRALRVAMILFVLAGPAGVAFHLNGAAEFQRELDPSQGWIQVLGKAVRAQAPPLLAPGVMLQLGLIGLIYTYRYPAVAGSAID